MRGAWLPWPGKTKATLICSLAPRGGYIPTRRESQRRHRRQCRPGDRGEALLGGIGDVRSRPRHAALGYRSGGLQTTTQAGGRTSPPRPVELSRPVSERELTWPRAIVEFFIHSRSAAICPGRCTSRSPRFISRAREYLVDDPKGGRRAHRPNMGQPERRVIHILARPPSSAVTAGPFLRGRFALIRAGLPGRWSPPLTCHARYPWIGGELWLSTPLVISRPWS